jgi:hypothetical protein
MQVVTDWYTVAVAVAMAVAAVAVAVTGADMDWTMEEEGAEAGAKF